jgi:hypothetical protein
MENAVKLCYFCRCIDFGALILPTVEEIEALNSGKSAPKKQPYQGPERSYRSYPQWSLGLQSQVENRSSSCSLCTAIRVLLDQWPQTREKWKLHNLGDDPWCIAYLDQAIAMRPKAGVSWQHKQCYILERLSICWHRATHFEAFLPGMVPVTYAGPHNVPKHVSSKVKLHNCFQGHVRLRNGCAAGTSSMTDLGQQDPVIFNGVIRPRMIDPDTPREWLQDCLSQHRCGFPNGLAKPQDDSR